MPNNDRDRALQALEGMDDDAGLSEILYAIHQQATVDRQLESGKMQAEMEADAKSDGGGWEWLGCLIGPLFAVLILAAFFFVMPLMFHVADSVLPASPRVQREGLIQSIEFVDGGDDTGLRDAPCRVYSGYIEIDLGKKKRIYPAEQVIYLELQSAE